MTFRVGFVPGVLPDTWARRWAERERRPLELSLVEEGRQREALDTGEVQMCLVRLPVDRTGLHLIPLYDEQPVVVMGSEHVLTLLDDVGEEDLAGETVNPGPPREAVETAAAGTGVVLVPMSIARLHHRKDVTFRVRRDVETTQVALAWRDDLEDDRVETFIGVVRGRRPGSSRDAQERARTRPPAPTSKPTKKPAKKPAAKARKKPGPAPRGRSGRRR